MTEHSKCPYHRALRLLSRRWFRALLVIITATAAGVFIL